MYSESKNLISEQNYRQRRQEAVREAREMAARSSFPENKRNSFAETSEAAVSSLKNFIKKIELDDIVLIGLFLMIADEGIEENFLILALIAILFFTD
ncbi:MAG: hypothetical protein IJN12_02405 [Clostridia bacterium]|nr:hypothetical protein [Clostridia bacterium]